MFFDGWPDLGRLLVVGSLAYVLLIAILRITGKRTLATLNAFDLVVTVALGSTLATVALSGDVSLSEGVGALALLVLLQLVVSWTSIRMPAVRRLVKSEPTILLHRGRMLPERLQANRVTPEEVRQAVRAAGYGGLELIEAVVLETDGLLSVIPRSDAGSADALEDVVVPEPADGG